MITTDDTLRLAGLAGLSLNAEELDSMTTYLNEMEEFVSILDEAGAENFDPEYSPNQHFNLRLREDIAVPFPNRDILLRNAPAFRNGYFTVPKVKTKG